MDAFLHDMSWFVSIRSEFLTPIFMGFTWLGYTLFFLIALPIGYWAWDKNKFTRLAILIFVSALINAYLKDLWQNPRPDPSIWLEHEAEGSFGMPSGHTQIGIVMWFWLAYEIRRTWAFVAAAIIASGIAFSRLYLGVHDVEDVLAGTVLGFASLGIYWWFFTDMFKPWHQLSMIMKLGIVAVALAGVLAIWPGGAGQAASIGGFLLAWMAGAAFDPHYTRFEKSGAWWKTLISSVGGVFGMIFLFEFLSETQAAIAPDSVLLSVVNGMVMAFYITVIAPRAFQMLNLAKRGNA